MKLIDKAIAYTIGACVVAIPTLVVWLLLAGPLAAQKSRTVPVRSNIIRSGRPTCRWTPRSGNAAPSSLT
jgi:hypothetical protein